MINRKEKDELDLNVIIEGFETHRRFMVEQNPGNRDPKRDLEALEPAEQKQRLWEI